MSSGRPATSPLFPRSALHPAVLAWADAHAHDDAPWCVAFSGGADSLALIVTLCEHWPERRAAGKLIALHYNHHLRGKDSDDDQAFCEKFCSDHLGLPVHFGHWLKPVSAPETISDVSEAEARKYRHEFLEYQMSVVGASTLWLGHQLDDIAETQLMRLARGSSTAGLAAPRPVHMHTNGRIFLRPLLALSKKQITDALRSRGLEWREDETNHGSDFFRNRIRSDVLPAWIAAAENNPMAGAALSRELLDEDATALDAWLDELLPSSAASATSASDSLDLRPLANKPRALLRRALRRWPPAAELARAGLEALIAICESRTPTRTSIGQHTALFENGILRITTADTQPPPFSLLFAPGPQSVTVTLPDGATLTAELVSITPEHRADILAGRYEPINTIFITPPPSLTPAFLVRSWLPGDRYQPLGAPGTAKISDLFINRKIPHARRLTLPVVCFTPPTVTAFHEAQQKIIWVPGLPPADEWKINSKTQLALHLTYQCGTCTVNH